VSTCRSCHAPVEWVSTAAGRYMQLDPGLHDDGNLAIGPDGRAHATDDRPARRSHFASCPNAEQHRRRRVR
jgi:hypothetical protein